VEIRLFGTAPMVDMKTDVGRQKSEIEDGKFEVRKIKISAFCYQNLFSVICYQSSGF
jgi:hypothetical protein